MSTEQAQKLQKLAQDAIAAQNACNLCGVVQSFARVMLTLMEVFPDKGTQDLNTHPIAQLWANKIADLARCTTPESYSAAYTECEALAK